MYVRKELTARLRPRTVGWFAHARPFGFEWKMSYAPDAKRFATGTANVAGVYAARAGMELIKEVGVPRIRAKNVRLMQGLLEAASAEGFRINSPRDPAQRSGVLCIDFPGADAAERELLRQGYQVDYRPRCGLRVSAHFYTTEDEIMSIVPALRRHRRRK